MCISREKLKLENMFGRYTYRGSISGYRLVRDQQGRVSEREKVRYWNFWLYVRLYFNSMAMMRK